MMILVLIISIILSESTGEVVEFNGAPIDIKKNRELTELPFIGKDYDVSFELKITKFGTDAFQSVLHLTLGEDHGNGHRIPGVWVTAEKKLFISSSVSGNANKEDTVPKELEAGKWIKVHISQKLVDGKYMYEVKVNGESVVNVENTKPEQFGPIKVFAGDDWYPNQEGQIKNLNIVTKPEGGINRALLSVIDIKKNQQIAENPYIGKEYDVSFELLITKFGTEPFQSVIHLTLGENHGRNGDRIPAVWVTDKKKLCIASAVSGDVNKHDYVPATELEADKWIKVQISQKLVDGKYMYDVKVNEESVVNVENTKPEKFGPIKVFAGDDWYPNQEGQIKNLSIVTKEG